MKTAMQELIDELQIERQGVPVSQGWVHSFYKAIIDKAQAKLEKENEQMQYFAKRCLNKALDLDIRTAYDMVEEYHKQKYSSSQPTFGDVGSQPTFGYISPQTTNL